MNCPHCNIEIGWMEPVQPSRNPPPRSGLTFTCMECHGLSRFKWNRRNHTKLELRPLTASEWFWLSEGIKAKIFSVGGEMPEGATWFSTWTPPRAGVTQIMVKPDVYEWLKDFEFNSVPKLQPIDSKRWENWQAERRAEQWRRAEMAEARRVYGELKELLRTKRRGRKADTAVVEGERG